MTPASPLTRFLAAVCALCPLCIAKRRFPNSAFARVMRRVERGCPFCRAHDARPVSYTHLRAHETPEHLVCRLLLEKKKIRHSQSHTL